MKIYLHFNDWIAGKTNIPDVLTIKSRAKHIPDMHCITVDIKGELKLAYNTCETKGWNKYEMLHLTLLKFELYR